MSGVRQLKVKSRILCSSRMPTDLSKFSIEPFDGSNFATWKWHLVQYLKNEKLMDVVLGTREAKDQAEDRINLILAQALKRDQLFILSTSRQQVRSGLTSVLFTSQVTTHRCNGPQLSSMVSSSRTI